MSKDAIDKIELWPINDVKPYPKNVKQHPDAQVRRIANSINTYGFDQPIVVDEDNIILKGHGRYLASVYLELEEVPVYAKLGLTDSEKRSSRIADNKAAESEYDKNVLWEEMSDLKDEFDVNIKDLGFTSQAMKSIFKEDDFDLSDFGIQKTNREEEYEKYHDEDKKSEDDETADATSVQIESFMLAFKDEKKYLRHMPMLDYLHLHDKILLGFSGGKDSVTEDSVMWFRIDGEVIQATPGELLDELITVKEEIVKDNGQIIVVPNETVETLMPTSMYQQEAEVDFGKVSYIMYHTTNKSIYEVTTHNNKTVKVTEDHSLVRMGPSNSKGLRIQEKTTSAKDLHIGDMLPTVKKMDFDVENVMDKNAVRSKTSIQASQIKSIRQLEQKTRRVFDFEVEDANHLFIADDIVVHNSLCGLIWALENIDRDKLIVYFGDLGWGIDWPHAVTYIKVIEKMYNTRIICSGEVNPYAEGGFHSRLIQYGFPHPVSCWVRNHIKIRNTKAVQMKYKEGGGFSMCLILSVRWAESENRRKTYSDRGILKDGNMHYASPILRWSDTDVCKYLWDRDLRLSTPYQHADRMGCIICPHENKKTTITARKKFPLLWRQILEWHARGARRTQGQLGMHHMRKLVAGLEDLEDYERKNFSGTYSPLALAPDEYEKFLEEKLGGELPCEHYTRIPFKEDVHVFPNDIDEEYYRRADLAPRTGDVCNLFG